MHAHWRKRVCLTCLPHMSAVCHVAMPAHRRREDDSAPRGTVDDPDADACRICLPNMSVLYIQLLGALLATLHPARDALCLAVLMTAATAAGVGAVTLAEGAPLCAMSQARVMMGGVYVVCVCVFVCVCVCVCLFIHIRMCIQILQRQRRTICARMHV